MTCRVSDHQSSAPTSGPPPWSPSLTHRNPDRGRGPPGASAPAGHAHGSSRDQRVGRHSSTPSRTARRLKEVSVTSKSSAGCGKGRRGRSSGRKKLSQWMRTARRAPTATTVPSSTARRTPGRVARAARRRGRPRQPSSRPANRRCSRHYPARGQYERSAGALRGSTMLRHTGTPSWARSEESVNGSARDTCQAGSGRSTGAKGRRRRRIEMHRSRPNGPDRPAGHVLGRR